MKELIIEKLKEIERKENIKILLAVESGSRAWGFASPDSDYDVRFIYIRPRNEYLRLDRVRDVIELPINDTLDINGWDLNKALCLLRSSNPTLFEWLSSPVVYLESDFSERLKPLMELCFSCKKGLYHYLSMAKSNYREYLRTDSVKLKKYFYVLRPIFACRWILKNASPPPMLFSDLCAEFPDSGIQPQIERLLDLKKNSPEIKLIPRLTEINEYIENSFDEISGLINQLEDSSPVDWALLNSLFLSELDRSEI